jgi:hypothetical protein
MEDTAVGEDWQTLRWCQRNGGLLQPSRATRGERGRNGVQQRGGGR